MKVLIVNRLDAFENFGGDTMQMIETEKELKKIGIDVEVSLGSQTLEKYNEYDVIHFFNIQTEKFTYNEILKAKKLKKKIAVSPIWWNYEELLNDLPDSFYTSKAKLIKKIFGKKTLIYMKNVNQRIRNIKRVKILDIANIILPNSKMEIDCLLDSFNKDFSSKCKVVYNGVDEKFEHITEIEMLNELKEKGFNKFDYVTQVGRIEVNKNTLLTIRACKELGIPLVLAGKWNEDEYFDCCKNEAKGHDVVFLGKRDMSDIVKLNKNAKAHILPSFRETPGLASLEAGALGCNVVTTVIGSTKEYFKEDAYYCDPSDYSSIKDSISKAWNSNRNEILKEKILELYTWKVAARQTMEAYINILE
ncbi:glycosyltransferase [Clostridium intestinale]|uniref:Glycosyltransferase involved in cell wall bisynthesis n=1 Tax=Clostridium intestinale DSM 6191 TaxID=1121320 RepID=A0A1M6DN25_9CLOT|nr:glycosyltransferase [Clostridium intestinale]SHI74600.1 Glycosyltransferase involved in cell wall bisynthesis [Clostridium intestinale DSM 6191]